MPTAKERAENISRRARPTRTSKEIEEDKISDDFDTALEQLARLGLRPRRDPNWAEDELEELEEMETDGATMTGAKSVARGAVGIPAGTLEAIGIGATWLKDQVGLSDDVEDNTFYNWGRALKKKGVFGIGAEGYIPNKFRGGAAGFLAVDAPQGVGSALGFVGEAALTGGVAAIGKQALKKGVKEFAVKDVAVDAAVRRSIAESEALAINLALKSGGKDVTEQQLKAEVKRLTPSKIEKEVRDRLQARGERLLAAGRASADKKFKSDVGTYSIAGIGGAVQAAEGYHDAYNTLLQEARKEGRDYLTKEESDQAFTAFFANIPAGFAEVFGVEAPLLRSIFLGKKLSKAEIAKYGGADKVVQQAGAISKTRRLWDNLDASSGGLFSRGMSRFAPVVGGITREALQEGSQSAWMNMVAADIAGYDENRNLLDGVAKDGGVGGVVGGLFGIASLVMGRKAIKIRDIERAKEQAQRAEEAGNTEAATEFRRQVRELEEKFDATESVDRDEASNELDQMDAGLEPTTEAAETAETAEEDAGLDLEGAADRTFSTYGVQLLPLDQWEEADQRKFRELNRAQGLDYDADLVAGKVGAPIYIGSTSKPADQRAAEHSVPDASFAGKLAAKYASVSPDGGLGLLPGVGQEFAFKTRDEAREAERQLIGKSSAYIGDPSMMKGKEEKKKPLTARQKKRAADQKKAYDKALKPARKLLKDTGKAQKFGGRAAGGYFVIDTSGKVSEPIAASKDATIVRDRNNDEAKKKGLALEAAKAGKNKVAARKLLLKKGQNTLREKPAYMVVDSKGKSVIMEQGTPPSPAKMREALGVTAPKKSQKPKDTPAEKEVTDPTPSTPRLLRPTHFTAKANDFIAANVVGATEETQIEILRELGPLKPGDKHGKEAVKKLLETFTPTKVAKGAVKKATAKKPAAKAETAEGASVRIPVSAQGQAVIDALNAVNKPESDPEVSGAQVLDEKVLNAVESMGRDIISKQEEPSFSLWALDVVRGTGGRADVLPYLRTAYNRLRDTMQEELFVSREDVDGAVGEEAIKVVERELKTLPKQVKKKVAKPALTKRERDERFFARRNATLLGLDPKRTQSWKSIFRSLLLDRRLLFFNSDGSSILQAGAGEPANLIELSPAERDAREKKAAKYERLQILAGAYDYGKKRISAAKQELQKLLSGANIVFDPVTEEYTYPALAGEGAGSGKGPVLGKDGKVYENIPVYDPQAIDKPPATTTEGERYRSRVVKYEPASDSDLRARYDVQVEEGSAVSPKEVAEAAKEVELRVKKLEAQQDEYAKALEKEFPGYLKSEESAANIIKSFQEEVSDGVAPSEIDNLEQHGGTYKTLAVARKTARALQRKEPHRVVGILRNTEGGYSIFSELRGIPAGLEKEHKVEGAEQLVALWEDIRTTEESVLDDEYHVQQEEVMASLGIDYEGQDLAAPDGKGNVAEYVVKYAEKIGVTLPSEVTELLTLADGTQIPRGLPNEIARQIAKATTGEGKFRGVPLRQIKFGKSPSRRGKGKNIDHIGSPMWTQANDGHDTIYIDPTSLVHSFRLGHTIEEFVNHELAHVVATRAVRAAVIHTLPAEEGFIDDKQLAKRISDTFKNIWRGHLKVAIEQAHSVQHLPHESEAYQEGVSLLEAMSQMDVNYNFYRGTPLGLGYETNDKGIKKPVAVGGSPMHQVNKGGEWVRALIDRQVEAGKGKKKMPHSIGDIAPKHTSGKVLKWLSTLTYADLGVKSQEQVPEAVQNIIDASRGIGYGTNAFIQRANILNGEIFDIPHSGKKSALDLVFEGGKEFIKLKMRQHYTRLPKDRQTEGVKGATTSTGGMPIDAWKAEPSFFAMHIPYFEERIIKDAWWHYDLLKQINNTIYSPAEIVPPQSVTPKRIKDRGTAEKGWAFLETNFQQEFAEVSKSWVYAVKDDITLDAVAKKWNTTEDAILRNNPRLKDILERHDGILPNRTRILMHGQPKGTKGGSSANAMWNKAWMDAKQNSAPIKIRRDKKADKAWTDAANKLNDLHKSPTATSDEINAARELVTSAKIAADIASEALVSSSRSSVNDLQGRTEALLSLQQSQMLGEIPSTRELVIAMVNDGQLSEYDAHIDSAPPPPTKDPSQSSQDIKAWAQLTEEKTFLMKALQEQGSIALITESGLGISTRDIINLVELLMEPHPLHGMLAGSVIKRKGATNKAGVSYLAEMIQKKHNRNASELRSHKKKRDALQDSIITTKDPIKEKGFKEELAKTEDKIQELRERNFDGGHTPSIHTAVQSPNLLMEGGVEEGRYEGEVYFEKDENNNWTGAEARKMLDLLGQILVESDIVHTLTDQTGKYIIPSKEQARKDLNEGVSTQEKWVDQLKEEMDATKVWNTKVEEVMVGVDETGKPVYKKMQRAPWESSHTRVLREEIVDENGVVVPALYYSTKEQWDKYLADGGTKPWQHHVKGFSDTLTYLPDSHKMRVVQAFLEQWRKSQVTHWGAATLPEMEQTFDYIEKFWELADEIKDEYGVASKKVKSRSKVADGAIVEAGRKGKEVQEMMEAFANGLLTGNPKGEFNNDSEIDPTTVFNRLSEILSAIEGNPKQFHPNDYQTMMAGVRMGISRLENYYEYKEGVLTADQQLHLDQLSEQAKDAAVNDVAQIAGTLALSKARNQLLGIADDMINWKKTIRKLQEKTLSKVVNPVFHDNIKKLITEASYRAKKDVVTRQMVEAIGRVAPSVDVRVAIEGALSSLEWNPKTNTRQYQVLKPALRAALDEKLGQYLTAKDIQLLIDGKDGKGGIWKSWTEARKKHFKNLLSEANLHDGSVVTIHNLLDSAERILRARDLGKLNKQLSVRAGEKQVELGLVHLWDALAPAVGLPYGKDKTSQMISKIQDRIASGNLTGVEAATLRYKVLKEVVDRNDLRWLSSEIARDVWYAGALSGLRTYMDIGLGGTIHGFMTTAGAALDVLLTRRGANPKEDAWNMMMSYFRTWGYDGIPMFIDILRTGDLSKLPDANERLMKQMTQEDFYGGESLEAMERTLKAENKPWWHPKKLVTLGRFSRRFVLGLDYVGAQAGRRAMMVYGASTRLWEAEKAGDGKDIADLKKQYKQAQLLANKDVRKKAMVDARAHLEKVFAEDKDIKVTHAMVLAKAREIMESDITDDLDHSSTELGRVFALNSDPIGIGAQIHAAAQTFSVLKYGAGLAFSRAAINMLQAASNYAPGIGFINVFRSSKMADKIFEQYGWNDSKWGKLLNLRAGDKAISEERAKVIQLQAITGTVIMAMLWQLLDDDDWEIHGSLDNLTSKKRKQLLSQGVKPYSIRYKGGDYWSFKATPIAMIAGAMGSIQDGRRYNGDDEKTVSQKLMAMSFNGFSFAMDVGPAAYSMRLLEMVKRSDEHSRAQFFAQFAQGWVGPIISPNLFREVDAMLDDRYYKPLKDQHLATMWANLVFFPGLGFPRKMGLKPMLNAFGEEVSVKRHPFSRWVSTAADDPVWQVVGEKSLEGVFLPGAVRGANLVTASGELRAMTPSEEYEYQRRTGIGIRYELEQNLDWFRNAEPTQAQRWLDQKAASIRKQLRSEMGRAAE